MLLQIFTIIFILTSSFCSLDTDFLLVSIIQIHPPTCLYREVVLSEEIWLDSCLVFYKGDTEALPVIKKTSVHSQRSRRYRVVTRSSAPGEITSNEMAKMARLFSASDMSVATWLVLSATRGGFSVTQRVTVAEYRRSVRFVASNALLAEKCQPHSARTIGEYSRDAYDHRLFFYRLNDILKHLRDEEYS